MRKADEGKSEIRVLERYPVAAIEFVGAPNDEQFAAYLSRMESISKSFMSRSQGVTYTRTAILFDTTHSTRPVTAAQRRLQAEFMRRLQDITPGGYRESTALCFVITNPLVRGVLTAILWLQPLKEKHKVFGTRIEADVWCRGWVSGTLMASEPPAATRDKTSQER